MLISRAKKLKSYQEFDRVLRLVVLLEVLETLYSENLSGAQRVLYPGTQVVELRLRRQVGETLRDVAGVHEKTSEGT